MTTATATQAARLEDVTRLVEYDVLEPGHPLHRVARARIFSRVLFARPEDMTYPHAYRNALNDVGFSISITQESLDNGSVRPVAG